MSRPSLLRDGICTKRRAADIGIFNVGENLKLDIDRLRVLEWMNIAHVHERFLRPRGKKSFCGLYMNVYILDLNGSCLIPHRLKSCPCDV